MKSKIITLFLFSTIMSYGQNTFPTTGNVGIGTSSPTSSLQIKKTSSTNGDIKIEDGRLFIGNVNTNQLGSYNEVKFKIDGSSMLESKYPYYRAILDTPNFEKVVLDMAIAFDNYTFSNISKKGDVVIRKTGTGNFIIANEDKNNINNIKFTTTAPNETYASTKLIITNNGNVGIGTETPDAKLAVNGDIHSKEVRIDLNNWPDYVFDQNYILPTIAQAEQHIKEKGHLINMPSAETIETKGLELGEITRLQQEKIEELTLYIIELNKRIERLEKSNNQKQ